MELHDALTDLAGTVTEDPDRLASVHARHHRRCRIRVAVTAVSTAGVLCGAVVAGALAFSPSSSGGPQHTVTASADWVDVATSISVQSPPAPKVAKPACPVIPGHPGDATRATSPPVVSPPEPLSRPTWTGAPPPIGLAFSLDGTVTATTNDSFTITAPDGSSVGTFVFPTVCSVPHQVVGSQAPQQVLGTEAHVAGTRTGPDTYDFTSLAVRA